MMSTAHTLASLPFGLYFPTLPLIFLLSFIWHFFLDSLPHWNLHPGDFRRHPRLFFVMAALDVFGGLIAARVIFGPAIFTAPLLAAIIGGNLPDVLQAVYDNLYRGHPRWLNWAVPFFKFHNRIQWELPGVWQGLISQIIIVSLSAWLMTRDLSA